MRARLRTYLITGLLVILPVAVTYLVLRWLFITLDAMLQPLFRALLGRTVPIVGFVAGILLILLTGVVASNVLGRRLIARLDQLILRIPLARTVYSSIKPLSQRMLEDRRGAFQRVVIVEWPRPGLFALGFVTGGDPAGAGSGLLHVFVPGTPNPTSGFVVLVPEAQTQPAGITVEEALRFLIAAGIARTPEGVRHALAPGRGRPLERVE
ncbi:MAG: DUF502 domain-containing protein [Armatimonadetes bacterium]|nr:DUF502 domain-containing protein [Armatimonadota bacterium]